MTRHEPFLLRHAWWMAPGHEICRFCAAAYYMEIAHHRGGCGRPVCPVCPVCMVVVFKKRIALCLAEGEF